MSYALSDEDLGDFSRDELVSEVRKLRDGIRQHRDSSGQDLCWHHPQLWNLLPDRTIAEIAVPPWPKFMRGCIAYRQSLERELPDAEVFDEESNANATKPIPESFTTITPFFALDETEAFVGFLKSAFGALDENQIKSDDGILRHATVRIGDSLVMISKGTAQFEPRPLALHLYVDDADQTYRQALLAGATSLREPQDQFYGDRSAGVQDHWGNHWWIATHIEDVDDAELKKREAAFRERQSD